MLFKSPRQTLPGFLTVQGTEDKAAGTITLTITVSKMVLATIENSRDAQAIEAVQIAREGRMSGEISRLLRGWAFVAKYIEEHHLTWGRATGP